ncbi:hypothetical protein ABG768_027900, partial [Culter alburnus]
MRSGFYSPYFIVPKKSGGLRPILDLRVLNRSLHKLPFKMLTQKRIFECIRPRDWFAAIDLKDAYFHVSILPRHRPFLRFMFEGRAYQYRVLPFGLALSPRIFTKITEGALVPMREQGVRIQSVVGPFVSPGRSAPRTSVPACCGFHRCFCHRLGCHVQRACSVRGLDGAPSALAHQLPRVAGSTPCSEPPQRPATGQACTACPGTATVAYINRQGGLRSRRMSQLARHLLLWSRKHLRSLRAIHVPGVLNRVADELSRAALPGEWRLHPQVVQLIWREFGEAQVDLFASPETSHCQLFYSLTGGTLGTDTLAHSWPRGLRKYAFPPVSLLAQTLCKVREDEEQVLLVAPYWPNRTWFPELSLLATAPPWPIPLRKDLLSQRWGTLWHPRPDLWKLHV